jgi:hypothetical protein
MAGLAETWSNIEVHSVIRFLQLKATSPAEIHRQPVEVYGANVMSRKHVWVWCTAFDNGRTAPVSYYGATIGRYWTILPTALTWHQVIFIFFGPFKKDPGGKQFTTDGEVQQAVMSSLQALDTDFFYAGIDTLVYRWDKCFGKYGDYVEK